MRTVGTIHHCSLLYSIQTPQIGLTDEKKGNNSLYATCSFFILAKTRLQLWGRGVGGGNCLVFLLFIFPSFQSDDANDPKFFSKSEKNILPTEAHGNQTQPPPQERPEKYLHTLLMLGLASPPAKEHSKINVNLEVISWK